MFKRDLVLFRSARLFSSTSKKKSEINSSSTDQQRTSLSGLCPICRSAYDNQKHKRLIDTTCQHEKCYTCMFKYEQCSICISNLVESRANSNILNQSNEPMASVSSSTIIANNLLVQSSPTNNGPANPHRTTPVKPVSNFQKLLQHFNGNKPSSPSFQRSTTLTSSQLRSIGNSTVLRNSHYISSQPSDERENHQVNEYLPPPPPPEFAHEQLLEILTQCNRNRISSISPSPSNSSAATHTSFQKSIINQKKQSLQINTATVSPSMSNSDISFSPSTRNVISPSVDMFSGYEVGPMAKSIGMSMIESQVWSSPRYITTPSSISPSNQSCPCGSIFKEDFQTIQDEQKSFIARHWVYDEMLKLLKSTTKPGLVLLSRTPGLGKSWLMKNLLPSSNSFQSATSIVVRNDSTSIVRVPSIKKTSYDWLKSHVLSSHFCDCSQSSSCSLPDIIHSIIYRALEHPLLHAYRDVILREQHTRKAITLNACIQNVENAFFNAFLDQLNQLKLLGHLQEIFSQSNHLYLILDGINHEQSDTEGPTITEFIFTHLHRLPSWLKLIITMNRLDNQHSQNEENRFLENFVLFELDDEGRWGNHLNNDIREYLAKRVENNDNNELYDISSSTSNIEQLCLLARGNLYFIQQLCDLIEDRECPPEIDLPRNIDEIFACRYFNRKLQERLDVCRSILEICLASRRPININILYNCLNIDDERNVDWSIFLQSLGSLSVFLTQYPNSTYAITNSSTRTWLMNNGHNSFSCDIRKGHRRLALYLSRSLTSSLHGPEAIECLRHLSLSDLLSENLNIICQRVKSLIDDPSRLLASLRNAFYPELDISELLLLSDANPDVCVDSIHMPLICIAAQHGYFHFLKLLVQYRANVNATTKNNLNKTALMLAADHGHQEIVKFLIESNADITIKDKHQLTAIAYATKHLSIVKLFPETDPSIQQQAFVYAAANGSLDAVAFLLDDNRYSSVDINQVDSVHGETAMTNAASNGHINILQFLISQHYANIDQTNIRQMTPLFLAVKHGMWSCVEYLLDQQASIEHCDQQGRTCLIVAASEGHLAVIDSLLEKGANIHHQDSEGLTALSWACLKGHYHACQTLLSHGSDVNHEDVNGRIPIDMASFYGDVQLVQLLIDHGSIIDHVDKNGMRALDRAIGCRNVAVVNCLLKKSVKLGPSTWALAAGKNDMMTILISKLIDDGVSLYKKNQYKDAAYRFSYALKKFPADLDQLNGDQFISNFRVMKFNCLINLAKSKRKLESYEAAVECCTQALMIQQNADVLLLRSRIKRDQKFYDDALADLLAAKTLDPTNAELDRYIGRLNSDLQQCHETLL